jgi:chaperonin GroEL (HSP60 family)
MNQQANRWLIHFTVLATQAIANVVKSSFGPSGLDKMMVDDIGVRFLVETDKEIQSE